MLNQGERRSALSLFLEVRMEGTLTLTLTLTPTLTLTLTLTINPTPTLTLTLTLALPLTRCAWMVACRPPAPTAA